MTLFAAILIQVGANLVDGRFNEKDRIELRCRLNPGVIPNPGALLVNKTSIPSLLEERLSPFISQLNKKGHKCLKTTDWSEGFILCARKQDKIYDAYADIRSYKSQIFQAQALAW